MNTTMTKIDPAKPYTQPRISAQSLQDAEFLQNGDRKAIKVYKGWHCSKETVWQA